jgi:predicted nucleic acid-binding protein
MLYFDTSFLAPMLLQEASSARVEALFATLSGETLAVSHWTRIEFVSLIAREVRMGGLADSDAQSVIGQFEVLVDESFHVLIPSVADYELARKYVQKFATKLRSGDALHLAIATNNKARMVYTLDKALLQAAKLLKIRARGLKAI